MPGTALVTINDNQWEVEVANTSAELIAGLAGRASIPAGTGMLFVLPVRQVVTVTTTEMLFPIDIIFIKDDAVLSIASNIQPGYLVEEATPCDGFLEVNAGETELVEVGDIITVEITTPPQAPGFDFSSIIAFAIPLAILGFVFGISGISDSGSSSNPKKLGSGNPDKAHPVHCVTCGWTGYRTHGPLTPCPKCGGVVVWTFTGKTKPTGEYYWEMRDFETGEIMQQGKSYTTPSRAFEGARSFQRGRYGKDKEHAMVIRVYDNPNMEEWGKTIRPVMEKGIRHGATTEIGKTPLQLAALDRLWPYGILEIHDDGDLTVFSQGKKWVVTTEGGVFGEEDILHLGGEMIEVPIGGFTWQIINHAVEEKHESMVSYKDRTYTLSSAFNFIEDELRVGHPKPTERGYEIKILNGKGEVVYTEWYVPKWMKGHSNPGGTEAYIQELPMCDFSCGRQALYDGRTKQGPWAYMCEEHFKQYGVGLGTGKGQKLILRKALGETEKIIGETEKELSVKMKEKDLEESVEEGLWYPKCPYCGAKSPAEPDADYISCQSCSKRFKIINPFFSSRYHSGTTVKCPICGEIIEVPEYDSITRSEALRKHIEEKHGKEHHSIHGEPRQRLVEKYGSWAVGRAEAICPEDDIACVTREAERLIGTIRSRYGEEAEYVTIVSAGATVFHIGDVVSIIALERENKRVRELGEREATYQL